MPNEEITLQEAQARLTAESKKIFNKLLHPDGYDIEIHVYDPKRFTRNVPNVSIRLWANGTWEYTDGSDIEEGFVGLNG